MSALAVELKDFRVLAAEPRRHLTPSVTTSLARGEILAVLGQNGVGKSLLTRALVGALASQPFFITEGTRSFVEQQAIGYVPQDEGLFAWRNVESNIRLPFTIRDHTKDSQDEIDRLIETFGLDSYRSRLPYQLSGGYRMRLALARALAGNIDLIVLDEPTRGLDPKVTELLRSTLHSLAKERGVAVWFVTHDLLSVLALADRCMILRREPNQALNFERADAFWTPEALSSALMSG